MDLMGMVVNRSRVSCGAVGMAEAEGMTEKKKRTIALTDSGEGGGGKKKRGFAAVFWTLFWVSSVVFWVNGGVGWRRHGWRGGRWRG